jgi:pilus assembly protein Flp/PilA
MGLLAAERLRDVPQPKSSRITSNPVDRRKTESEDCMKTMIKRLWSEEEGQDLIEYALLVALVALAAAVGMNSLATAINAEFTTLGTSLTTAT